MNRLLLAVALSVLAAGPAMAQTVILVRHAEKADPGADPVLSEAGQARAGALAVVLADAPLTHVLITPLQRTGQTAAPAALAHSVTPEALTLEGGADAHADRVAARIRALPEDSVVLVSGHSNTIPVIARALGYAAAPDMTECEYDRLTVLDLDGERVTAVVGRYGVPTDCE